MLPSSPSGVAVLAANASTALGLIARDVYDDLVLDGLRQGDQFCEILQTGEQARTASHFSAGTLAAGRISNLVLQIPEVRDLASRVDEVRKKLQTIQTTLSIRPNDFDPIREAAEELREYFLRFASSLPYYNEVQRRLSGDLRGRG